MNTDEYSSVDSPKKKITDDSVMTTEFDEKSKDLEVDYDEEGDDGNLAEMQYTSS